MAAESEQPQNATPGNESLTEPNDAVAPQEGDNAAESLINISIALPDSKAESLQLTVSSQEQIHEIRQSLIDLPSAFQYTCFHLEYRPETQRFHSSCGGSRAQPRTRICVGPRPLH
uniref:Clustered mitochondria protein N-terminal domain-containing protein n=1 Tax=Bionectria ochroleuca TaxID=29856 RepID=A0A8H7NLG2_BIOOC